MKTEFDSRWSDVYSKRKKKRLERGRGVGMGMYSERGLDKMDKMDSRIRGFGGSRIQGFKDSLIK